MKNDENTVVFGEFTLDLTRRCLFRNGQRLHLTPRPFETLAFLVTHSGQIVDKRQLFSAVWKDVSVTDGSLVQAIREVRRALEDNDQEPQYIQTIPRVGYRFVAEVASHVPPPPPIEEIETTDKSEKVPSKNGRWAAAGAAVLAAMAISFLVFGQARAVRRQSAGISPDVPWSGRSIRQLTNGRFNANKPQYSPDGQSLLFLSHDPDAVGLDLFMLGVTGGKLRQLTKGANATGDWPVFTADGSKIVFSRLRDGHDGTRLRDLWAVPSSGGTPRLFLAEASGAGFSPDGTEMAYTKYVAGRKALWMGHIGDDASHREIASRGFAPRWSPDGHWIAYTTSDFEGGAGYLWLVADSPGSDPVRLTAEPEDMYGHTWARDSRTIFIASDRGGQGVQLRQVPISGGPPMLVTAGVGHYYSPTASPNGRTLSFSHVQPFSTLVITDSLTSPGWRDSGHQENNRGHLWPRLSPSGHRVASVVRLYEGERLWITDADTGERLRANDRLSAHPDWVDDNRVAYLGDRTEPAGTTPVYVMDVESDRSSQWFEIAGKASWLAVHSNQHTVAYVLQRTPESQQIVVRDLRVRSEKVIASGGQYERLRWTPRGSTLAWSGPAESGNISSNGVWIAGLEGATAQKVVKDGYSPAWNANGDGLYFVRLRGRNEDTGLWRYDLLHGNETKIRSTSGVQLYYYDVVGTRLVSSSNNETAQVFEMSLTP